jgi:hypothetical protein
MKCENSREQPRNAVKPSAVFARFNASDAAFSCAQAMSEARQDPLSADCMDAIPLAEVHNGSATVAYHCEERKI